MLGTKMLLTIMDPPGEFYSGSKLSMARRLKSSSTLYQRGFMLRSAEDNGGNSIGELFPLIHMSHDKESIQELINHPRRLMKEVTLGGIKIQTSQAVYTELDQVDLAKMKEYDTNAVILVGCKVLEAGSRTAMELERNWRSWTNIGVLINYLKQVKTMVQNMVFMKQMVPMDPKIFMYCILLNMQIEGQRDEANILQGLQRMRGSVLTGYASLYTVMGDLNRTKSEESIDRLIETVSSDDTHDRSRRARQKDSRHERTRSVNTV